MNIYKMSQRIITNYCYYESIVVAAESEAEARNIHPDENVTHNRDGNWFCNDEIYNDDEWVPATRTDEINVEHIGIALPGIKKGILNVSFSAIRGG